MFQRDESGGWGIKELTGKDQWLLEEVRVST